MPTLRTVLLVALVGLSAIVVPGAVVVLLLVAIAAAATTDWLLAGRLGTVAVEVPSTVARAASTAVRLTPATTPAGRVRLRQPTPPDVVVTPAFADGRLDGTITASRRGAHRLPPPVARVEGPFGLAARDHVLGPARDLIVLPDLPAARRLAVLAREGRLPDTARPRGAIGLGTEFDRVRDYSPDDDVRQINWRATQRVGRPMANAYRVDEDRDVHLLVDTGRLLGAPVGDCTLLDVAVDAACAVAATADALGDRVGAVVFADRVLHALPPRRRGAGHVARALHDVESAGIDSDYLAAFMSVARRKRGLVLVFTDLLEESAARALLEALPTLARRHAVAVATIDDGALTADVRRVPAAPYDVLRASVAADVLAQRRRVAARLTGGGAELIDAAPQRLSAACVRAYLRLKARARV